MTAAPSRFKVYAITGSGHREKVRWTDTLRNKDHHKETDESLYRCKMGFDGFTPADAEAFKEVRERFLGERSKRNKS